MIHHESTVHVKQPVEQVFTYLAEPQKLALWQSNLVSMEPLTAGPLHAGSRFREVRVLRGRQSKIDSEVSDFEPYRRLATRTLGQPHVTVSYALRAENGGTRLTHEFTMETAGMMRLLEPVISRSIGKESDADLQRLKQLLESSRS